MENLSSGAKLAIFAGEFVGSLLFGRAVARVTCGALCALSNDDTEHESIVKSIIITGASAGTGYAGYRLASAGFAILNARLGIFADLPEVDVVTEG